MSSKTWQLSSGSTCAPGRGEPGRSPKVNENHRSGGFHRSDTEGKTHPIIRPSPSPTFVCVDCRHNNTCMTVRRTTHAIHVLLNTTFTAIARATCVRPEKSREEKSKSYSRPRDLSTYYHPRSHLARRYDYEKLYKVYLDMPPFYPSQTKQKTGSLEKQIQRTMKEKQRLCGGGDMRWWFATKTRQDQDRSALHRPTSSGSGQRRRHPRRGCCYRSSRFQYPVVAR